MTDLEAEVLATPPHSAADEAAVLGALVCAYASLDDYPWLAVEHFHVPAHQVVFLALAQLHRERVVVEAPLLVGLVGAHAAHLDASELIARLANGAPLGANVRWHAKTLGDYLKRRQLLVAAYECAKLAREWEDGTDTAPLADQAEHLVTAAVRRDDVDQRTWSAEEGARGVLDHVDQVRKHGMPSIPLGLGGFAEAMTGGWWPGQLVIVAGRPSMGKSALALWFALQAALDGHPTELFSLEMTRLEVYQRACAALGRVDSRALQRAKFVDNEELRLLEAVEQLTQVSGLWVTDKAGMTLRELEARVRRRVLRSGAKLVVVDYLQLIREPSARSRYDEVSEISRRLKALALDLEITVIATAQLNRKCEDRADKRPTMADLRESGQVEQDANVICLLFREDYYDSNTDRKGLVDLIWCKNRNGDTGTTEADYSRPTSRFQGR